MSISVCLASGGNARVPSCTVMAETSQEGTLNLNQDRSILDLAGGRASDIGEEAKHVRKAAAKAAMPQFPSGAASMVYSTSKSKKCYISSSSRKKQNQQHIINSLKSLNFKIAPSGLDKLNDEPSTANATPFMQNKVAENLVYDPKKETTQWPVTTRSVPVNVEPANKLPVAEGTKTFMRKKVQEIKTNNVGSAGVTEEQSSNNAGSMIGGRENAIHHYGKKQADRKHLETSDCDNGSRDITGRDGVQSHAHSAHPSETLTQYAADSTVLATVPAPTYDVHSRVPSTAIPESQQPSSTIRGNQLKYHHKSSVRSNNSTNETTTSASYVSNGNGKDKIEERRTAKGTANISQSRVSVMSMILQGGAKQKESVHFTNHSGISSSVSKTIHPTQQHAHVHQTPYINQVAQPPTQSQPAMVHHTEQHQSGQNAAAHQYSFDFLRDVGLSMPLVVAAGGNGTTGDGSVYHVSPPMNYNFTQQFQQHMVQHNHNNHLHQHNHSNISGTVSNQQQQQLSVHRIMPQQHHHYHRCQNGYVDDLVPAHSGAQDTAGSYSNYAFVNAGETHGCSMQPSKNFDLSSYVYNHNAAVQSHNQQGLQYTNQPSHQQQQHQQQQQHAQMHNHHQNNNYQYHNRNGNVAGGKQQLNYTIQGSTRRPTVHGTNREDGGRNGNNGKKYWNTHGKGKCGSLQSNGTKHVSKVQSIGYGYRKNYHHYHSHPVAGGNSYYDHAPVQQQPPQQHYYHHNHKQQHVHRNLVYVRGYDRGHGAIPPHEYSGNNAQQEIEQTELILSTSSDHKVEPGCVPGSGNTDFTQEAAEPSGTIEPTNTDPEQATNGPTEMSLGGKGNTTDSTPQQDEYELKTPCKVPRSSSSSSVISIPSTESSTISLTLSRSHLLEVAQTNGNDYESDSSHSSDFQDGTYRYSKYSQPNGEKVYRSSSSTSSGISSSATYPPSSEYIPSKPSYLPASNGGLVSEFFIRSQSYHGSHQNLSAYGSGGSAGDGSPPIGSPTGTPRPVPSTQSVPIFGELFGNSNHSHPTSIQFTNSQSITSFESSSSLELALQTAAASSSSSSSLSVSSVPPNDFQSMQSGYPKTRSQSGRNSPNNATVQFRMNRGTIPVPSGSLLTTGKGQPPNSGSGRRSNEISVSYVHRTSLPADFQYTPADRFILRANDVELKIPPDGLTNGSSWDALSQAVWDKFVVTQQTEAKYLQKMQLWRDLYLCIKKGFPKYSLYLVGSTISGFGADSSDVDMCLVSRSAPGCYDPRLEALLNLSLVKEYFVNMPSSNFSEFSLIQAKVPILRFQDCKNGIEVDLNFNNCVGIRNTHLLHCYSQMDWRVRPLVLAVKLWAQHHNINDAKNMTISSYSLVLMVIHFLQCGTNPPVLPCLHAFYPEKFMKIIDIHNIEMIERIEPYQTDNKETLGELLLQFLEYYTTFDYEHYAISVRTSSIIPIEECRSARSYKNDPHHWKHLCIEEPFDFTNTARSVFDGDVFEQIKSTFATSWRMLKDSKNLSDLFGEPLFTPVTSTLSITS